MRYISENKIYDTEKSHFYMSLKIAEEEINLYKTVNGAVFGVTTSNSFYNEAALKHMLSRNPLDVDIYIQIFGEPEEA